MAAGTEATRGDVLVLEDEFLVSLSITALLEDLGFSVPALTARVSDACALIERRSFALAVLDINLAGEMSWPVARMLKERGTPFFFLSGYSDSSVQRPLELQSAPLCLKPLSDDEVARVIEQLLDR